MMITTASSPIYSRYQTVLLVMIAMISLTITPGLDLTENSDGSACTRTEQTTTKIVSNITVTDEHRRRYHKDGFVVFDNFLNKYQLNLWRQTIDNAVLSRGESKFAPGSDMEDGTNEDLEIFDKVFTQRINLHMDSDEMNDFLIGNAGQDIGRIARELTASSSDHHNNDLGFRLWHNQALYKEPYANPTSWHVDVPYWSFNSTKAISAWIALDDSTIINGCLHFLPQSHRILMELNDDPYQEVKIGKNLDTFFRESTTGSALSKLEPVPVPMRAGSISFHNGLTVHAAGPNMTPRRRRAMTYQLMPIGDNIFNGKRNILGKTYFDSLKVGDILDNDDVNPIL